MKTLTDSPTTQATNQSRLRRSQDQKRPTLQKDSTRRSLMHSKGARNLLSPPASTELGSRSRESSPGRSRPDLKSPVTSPPPVTSPTGTLGLARAATSKSAQLKRRSTLSPTASSSLKLVTVKSQDSDKSAVVELAKSTSLQSTRELIAKAFEKDPATIDTLYVGDNIEVKTDQDLSQVNEVTSPSLSVTWKSSPNTQMRKMVTSMEEDFKEMRQSRIQRTQSKRMLESSDSSSTLSTPIQPTPTPTPTPIEPVVPSPSDSETDQTSQSTPSIKSQEDTADSESSTSDESDSDSDSDVEKEQEDIIDELDVSSDEESDDDSADLDDVSDMATLEAILGRYQNQHERAKLKVEQAKHNRKEALITAASLKVLSS